MKKNEVLDWKEMVSGLKGGGALGIVARSLGGGKVQIFSLCPLDVSTLDGQDVFRKNIAGAKSLFGSEVVHFPEDVSFLKNESDEKKFSF